MFMTPFLGRDDVILRATGAAGDGLFTQTADVSGSEARPQQQQQQNIPLAQHLATQRASLLTLAGAGRGYFLGSLGKQRDGHLATGSSVRVRGDTRQTSLSLI